MIMIAPRCALRSAATTGSCGRCCRRPAASIRAAPSTPTRRIQRHGPWRGSWLAAGASAAAARGIPAATTRCPNGSHGYATPHPAVHLRLLAADAVGSVGEGEAAEARAGRAAGTRSSRCPLPSKPPAPAAQRAGQRRRRRPPPSRRPLPRSKGEIVRVSTDLIVAEIDTLGGTLKRVELLKHKDSKDPTKNLVAARPRAPLRGAERP